MFGFFSRTIDHRDAYIIHGLHVNLFNWNWCIEKDPFAKRAPLENAHHNMNVHYKNGSHQMNKYHQVHEHQYCIYYSKDVFSMEKKTVGRPFQLKWNSIPTVSFYHVCVSNIFWTFIIRDMKLYCIFLLQQFQIQLIDSNGISDFGFYSQIAMKKSNFAISEIYGFSWIFLLR